MQPLAAIATPRRREILRLVWDRETSAGDIHQALPDVTFGAISQHLGVLEKAGLVVVRRDGRRRLYRAQPDALGPLRLWLESTWDDALYRLKVQAELEQARRGPRPARHSRRSRPGPHSTGDSTS
jgi:DNA-binding transcriptional ArsR family regulator